MKEYPREKLHAGRGRVENNSRKRGLVRRSEAPSKEKRTQRDRFISISQWNQGPSQLQRWQPNSGPVRPDKTPDNQTPGGYGGAFPVGRREIPLEEARHKRKGNLNN